MSFFYLAYSQQAFTEPRCVSGSVLSVRIQERNPGLMKGDTEQISKRKATLVCEDMELEPEGGGDGCFHTV